MKTKIGIIEMDKGELELLAARILELPCMSCYTEHEKRENAKRLIVEFIKNPASEVGVQPEVSREVGGRLSDKYDELAKEIAELINRKNLESDSDAPDFILAEYLVHCLKLFNWTSNNG